MREVSILSFITVFVLALGWMPLHAAGNWDVHPTPLDLMQEAGVPINVDAISKFLAGTDQDVQLRYWAAMALGQLADASAMPVLIESLSDSDATVRAGASAALGHIPDSKSVQPLCKTALGDADMAPRHNATGSLGSIMTDEATDCLVRVAANELETKKVRLHSLILIEQQIADRKGFEILIPTMQDQDPTVKGMAALVLSLEYESEPQISESLSVVQSLIEAAMDPGIDGWIYIRVIERLEQISGRKFLGNLDGVDVIVNPEVRTLVNGGIQSWAAE